MSLIAPPQNQKPRYMVQLDALRALAVFGVLVHHFLPQEFFLNSKLHWGPLGVRLFFVLSGFLITGILLRCRELVDSTQQDAWFTIKRFYMRRFIRLVPVYYLTIFFSIIFAGKYIKNSLFWHLTYTSNIYFSINEWDAVTSHFWSLSVEEQFYLFWGLFIIMLPKKYLLPGIILTTIIGPVFRLLIIAFDFTNGSREYILTFACFDSLGIGALMAFFNHNQEQFKRAKKYLYNFCFWVGIPLFIAFNLISIPNLDNTILLSFGSTTASMFFVWLIEHAARGFSGWIGVILELPALVYLGKISYGIYVYHLLVAYALNKILTYFGFTYPAWGWNKFVLSTVATLIVAVLSWHFFEKPINALKRNFEYKK
ncbi:acyltransferase [Tolypothrix sp. NIES-4075]|uniref:acyltransferase family protein n=1 Tax=Tolypothrix sp. NIES-4075 TaxID=2005459 RepID=UPI000B5C1E8C|nr:acyltransferase [Tolypothrix sp. NIES-4075]GAX42591.1 acyltransferase [Tolypothrix sp. NIES-4075]